MWLYCIIITHQASLKMFNYVGAYNAVYDMYILLTLNTDVNLEIKQQTQKQTKTKRNKKRDL